MGGTPPSPLKSSFLGGQKACLPFLGGAETEQSACAMGKRGPPLANAIFISNNTQCYNDFQRKKDLLESLESPGD